MNVYDQAHQLATAIKESEEFKHFDTSRKALEANPELDNAMKDFMKKQFEVQAQQMMGEENRLRMLKMRETGHDQIRPIGGQLDETALHLLDVQ